MTATSLHSPSALYFMPRGSQITPGYVGQSDDNRLVLLPEKTKNWRHASQWLARNYGTIIEFQQFLKRTNATSNFSPEMMSQPCPMTVFLDYFLMLAAVAGAGNMSQGVASPASGKSLATIFKKACFIYLFDHFCIWKQALNPLPFDQLV